MKQSITLSWDGLLHSWLQVSCTWRKFRYFDLMFTRFWTWEQCLTQVAFLHPAYFSWSAALSRTWLLVFTSSRAFLVAWLLAYAVVLTLRLPCIFLFSWRIHQVGFEAVCWQCSSSGDIRLHLWNSPEGPGCLVLHDVMQALKFQQNNSVFTACN